MICVTPFCMSIEQLHPEQQLYKIDRIQKVFAVLIY